MSKLRNNCLLEKQSILQTTLFHETEALEVKMVFLFSFPLIGSFQEGGML